MTFWGDRLYRACRDEDGILINLASKEYSRAVAPYLQPEDRLVEVIFGEQNGERIVQKRGLCQNGPGEKWSGIWQEKEPAARKT